MDKNDKKTATTETQKNEFSASEQSSDSVVAREALKEKVEELEDKYKRALADYQNLEKRVAQAREDLVRTANKELLLRLLPVLDTLILAEKHGKAHDEGFSLGIKQFQDILESEGVEKIEALGKSFDPKLMECIETIAGEEHKVLEEVRTGYALHGNVLRPALVKVGKKEQ